METTFQTCTDEGNVFRESSDQILPYITASDRTRQPLWGGKARWSPDANGSGQRPKRIDAAAGSPKLMA